MTPVFLHGSFQHILYNIVSQLIFGIRLESTIGTPKFIILYFMAGISGNLLSSLVIDFIGVGASTSIFGILGAYLAYIFLNWK